jgi:hypothetical protein
MYSLDRIARDAVLSVKYTVRRGSMKTSAVALCTLLLAGSALAADDEDRAKLAGKWQQSEGNGEARSTWTLENMGDSIHVINSNPTETIEEFDCNTLGKECAIKKAGHKSKVSLWFNGAALIELETTGNRVVKRRFTVTGNGDTMDLETIPIVPGGQPDTVHFKRTTLGAAKV